ncbi:MAG: CBS domain-containing protein, partial [Saprospiraceae bacterium]|nr:CBS domain-containing protein [Saprospiraceae bacterium]
MMIKVKDFMTSPVATAVLDSDVGKLRDIMKLKGYSAIPIVELKGEDILIRGIVTKNDLMGVFDDTVKAGQIMTKAVYVIDSDYGAPDA